MKLYIGKVRDSDWNVFVLDENDPEASGRLDPGYRYVNHSPDGFAWGYGGSGPAQLAFALLLDVTGNIDRALAAYQDYKWQVIAKLPIDQNFQLTEAEVMVALQRIEEKYAHR
jgi:hypothetical protein